MELRCSLNHTRKSEWLPLSPTCHGGSSLYFKAAVSLVMAAATTLELTGTFWRAELCGREGGKVTEMLGWKKKEETQMNHGDCRCSSWTQATAFHAVVNSLTPRGWLPFKQHVSYVRIIVRSLFFPSNHTDWTQVVSLDIKYLYILSHLTGPKINCSVSAFRIRDTFYCKI